MASHRKELIKILKKEGFELVRSKRHFIWKNAKNQTIIMPNHNKMSPQTFKGIQKQIKAALEAA